MTAQEGQARTCQTGEHAAATVHANDSKWEQPAKSKVDGRDGFQDTTWLHVSFRVQGKGACELGAAVVLTGDMDTQDATQELASRAESAPCRVGPTTEQQKGEKSCMAALGAVKHCDREIPTRNQHDEKEKGRCPHDGRVLGFVTTVFKPDMHGMEGGRACVRLGDTNMSSRMSNSLYIVNPYAPKTLRRVHVTEWCNML